MVAKASLGGQCPYKKRLRTPAIAFTDSQVNKSIYINVQMIRTERGKFN